MTRNFGISRPSVSCAAELRYQLFYKSRFKAVMSHESCPPRITSPKGQPGTLLLVVTQ